MSCRWLAPRKRLSLLFYKSALTAVLFYQTLLTFLLFFVIIIHINSHYEGEKIVAKIEMFRKALALPEVIQNVELTGILKDLYTDYLELLEKNNELKDKLKSIDDIADIKKKAKVKNGFYTLEGVTDIEGNEIPFCLNCLYEYGVQIPMIFGVVERGTQELFSGQTLIPTTYGISCRKCGTHLAMSKK